MYLLLREFLWFLELMSPQLNFSSFDIHEGEEKVGALRATTKKLLTSAAAVVDSEEE